MTAGAVFLLIAVPLLVVAASRDIATRLIPDGVSIAIAATGIVTRLFEGWAAAATSAGIALGLFILLLLIAMRGMIGGGDVKLIAAMAAGLSPADTWTFVFVMAVAGGVLGVAYILGSRLVPELSLAPGGALPRRVLAIETRRIRRRGPLPYAVAIAAGGLFLLITSPGA